MLKNDCREAPPSRFNFDHHLHRGNVYAMTVLLATGCSCLGTSLQAVSPGKMISVIVKERVTAAGHDLRSC